jgi:hypothetical protein
MLVKVLSYVFIGVIIAIVISSYLGYRDVNKVKVASLSMPTSIYSITHDTSGNLNSNSIVYIG